MSLPDHKDTERYTEYIAFYHAKRSYTEPLLQDQDRKQEYEYKKNRQLEEQDHNGQHPKQYRGGELTSAPESQIAENLLEKAFQRSPNPRRTQSWSMEDQKHEFHRRLMNLGAGAERGFSET
ncbi:hypothetical protein BJX63DRAFT_364485 [Aspergillus granulosus]|uniref:Uncharacterized protein n=1 Tax=Aspergillus granulosus TaxID=176169 RepID=A0ABR4H1Q6_9EURO